MTSREHYHHGDLRAALVAEGLKQVEAGETDLSLRALAKAAGVSPNAPYRHFPDKDSLVGAVAAEGFRQFADVMTQASAETGMAALRNQSRAYLEFALARPALYRLMFSPYGYSLKSEICGKEAGRAFGSLVATTARAQAEGWKRTLALPTAALSLWSALHGWASLISDRLIPPEVPAPSLEEWLDGLF